MQIAVSDELHGKRLDQTVAAAMPSLSRAFIQKLCDDGRVTVNGQPGKAGYKLRPGDGISVAYDPSEFVIPPIDLPLIYEDGDCVVINKPAGVLTHALGKHGNEPSVASFLRHKILHSKEASWKREKDGVIDVFSRAAPLTESEFANTDRAGIVHRLDRATSGVIIGAKNQHALSLLQKQFSQRKVKKTYIAVVEGRLDPSEAVIDMPVERNPKAPATFRVGPNGKPSQTHYKVLEEGKKCSLVELKPETGRTHQLRVHLAKVGHPIVGDPLYGTGKYGDRLFLHAQSLEITLPSGERRVFSAPLPDEFKDVL